MVNFPVEPILLRTPSSLVDSRPRAARVYLTESGLQVSSLPPPAAHFGDALLWHPESGADPELYRFSEVVTRSFEHAAPILSEDRANVSKRPPVRLFQQAAGS